MFFPCIAMDLEKTCTKILPLHPRDRRLQCSVPAAEYLHTHLRAALRFAHGVERGVRLPSRCNFFRNGRS